MTWNWETGTKAAGEKLYAWEWNNVRDYAFQKSASYIVYSGSYPSAGGPYFAQNGLTGRIDYSGSDTSTVIQSAIDALTNGGKIYIKAGTFTFVTPIYWTLSNIVFEGEGNATVIEITP